MIKHLKYTKNNTPQKKDTKVVKSVSLPNCRKQNKVRFKKKSNRIGGVYGTQIVPNALFDPCRKNVKPGRSNDHVK